MFLFSQTPEHVTHTAHYTGYKRVQPYLKHTKVDIKSSTS